MAGGRLGWGLKTQANLTFYPHLYARLWHPASFYLLLPCSRPPARGRIFICASTPAPARRGRRFN